MLDSLRKKTLEEWEAEFRWHHQWIGDLIRRYLPDDGRMIDVGANIGRVSEHAMAGKPNAQALLFEPIIDYAAICRERFAGQPNVTVAPCGLSDEPGLATIHATRDSLGWNTLDPAYAGEKMQPLTVALLALDMVPVVRCDVLKIDTEGWEGKVIKGAHQTIMRCRPVIIMELSLGSCDEMWQEKVAQLEWMFSIGYQRIDYQISETTDKVLLPGVQPWAN
jgi:FkbM family methyltransferase